MTKNFSGSRDEGGSGEFPGIHSAETLRCGTFNLEVRTLGIQRAVVVLCASQPALLPLQAQRTYSTEQVESLKASSCTADISEATS